ncbi:Uncharacterized protein Fot_19725 [Forsythia ovata]|uniref:Reverse transcriptase zinc-binding domain-containing protein n=1 Tax=Forsythia ovata TaxID=205694 RepID=A0ABD1VLU8_9LAMI
MNGGTSWSIFGPIEYMVLIQLQQGAEASSSDRLIRWCPFAWDLNVPPKVRVFLWKFFMRINLPWLTCSMKKWVTLIGAGFAAGCNQRLMHSSSVLGRRRCGKRLACGS